MRTLNQLVRKNLINIKPYSSAREEFEGEADVYLDANENPFDKNHDGFNRYPDPLQKELKIEISKLKNVAVENIFLSNGSDEAIDWLVRLFCQPKEDAIIYCPPTFGMYKVVAKINEVEEIIVPLKPDFTLDTEEILKQKAKILFLCSPNNPTGHQIEKSQIVELLENFDGIVVLDEAYVDFAEFSLVEQIKNYPNLVILQTFSKAWAMAGLRLGMTFASKEIIAFLTKLKMPYNVNSFTQKTALNVLAKGNKTEVTELLDQKEKLRQELSKLSITEKIFPSAANFWLVRFKNASEIYKTLAAQGLLVRNQSYQPMLENCLRITVGTPKENEQLISALQEI